MRGVTEDLKWENNLCFCVGGKIFCMAHTDPPFTVAFKLPKEQFEELVERDGIVQAPYMAKGQWVQVISARSLKETEWNQLIIQAYELVKAKLTKAERLKIEKAN